MNATLALLLRLTSSGIQLSDYWVGVGCASILAIEHFNTRNATVVPELAALKDSPVQLQPLVLNTDSLQAGGLTAYRAALAAEALGIVGPSRSAVSQPTAQLGAIDKLPQLSFWASSPTLSDKSIYSHFGRTYPSDSVSGELLMQTASAFGWTNVACIHINDLWAQGLLSVMQSWSVANPGGARIALASTFDFGDATSVQRAVLDVATSGLNIIIFIVFDNDLDALLSAADEAGLLGDEYVWICTDTTTADSPANTPSPALTAQRLAGSLAVAVAPSLTEHYGRLASVWDYLTPADCANDLFNATDLTFSTEPPDVGAFAYDAVIAFGLAFAAVHAEGVSLSDGDAVRDRLWSLGFNGSTGECSFSRDTGDRRDEGLTYVLSNMQLQDDGGLALHSVGAVVPGSAGSMPVDAPIVWRGGGSATPVDLTTAELSCEPGTVEDYSSATTPTCTQCEAGTYEVSRKLCTPADSYSFVPSAGASEAIGQLACPAGTRVLALLAERSSVDGLGVQMQPILGGSNASQCVCDTGSYNAEILADPAWVGAPRCEPCPSGAICAGGNLLPVAMPGFALLARPDSTEAPFFLPCKGGPLACPGGTIEPLTSSSTSVDSGGILQVTHELYRCGDGYLNGSSGCYRCEDGYGMQAKQCVECRHPSVSYIVLNALFVLLWFPVLHVILTQYIKSFYTSIAFIQFLGVYASFPVPWSSDLADLFEAFGSFNLNLDALLVSCSADGGGLTYRSLWGIQMALPLFYPVACAVHLAVGRTLTWLVTSELPTLELLLRAGWRPRRDFSFTQLVNAYLPNGLFYLNMYLMMGVGNSFRMLSCADDGHGSYYLRADPGIECWKGDHVGLAAFAVLGVIVYLGLVPAIYCWVLFVVLPRRGRQSRAAKAFAFIYGRFEAEYSWWELIESGRKVVFVSVAIFAQGHALEQSVVALAAVVAVLMLDLLNHPYSSGMYDVLEEVLAFVEFMILLLGLVALAEPDPGGWHESTALALLFGALALIAYVAIFDLDSVWQRHRAHRLRTRHKLTLSPAIWDIIAFDSVLLDWLEKASPEELENFGGFEARMMRALFSGALDPTKITRQYTEQLKALPFLLNNICGKSDGSLVHRGGTTLGSRVVHLTRGVGTVIELMSDGRTRVKFDSGEVHRYKPHRLQAMQPFVRSMGETLGEYLSTVSSQPFGGSAMPMHSFFQRGVRGALCAWLARSSLEQVETRVQLHSFFASIIAFADAQRATMPWHTRLTKRLRLHQSHSRRAASARRAVADHAKAQAKPKPGARLLASGARLLAASHTVDLAESVKNKVGTAGTATRRRMGNIRMSTRKPVGVASMIESDTERLLARLLKQLRCEMVEVVAMPAEEVEQNERNEQGEQDDPPPPRTEQLVSAAVVHPSVQFVRQKHKGQAAWSRDGGTPVGLCTTKLEPVFVENGHFTCGKEEGQLHQRLTVGEISQLCVPIFQHRRLSMKELVVVATSADGPSAKVNDVLDSAAVAVEATVKVAPSDQSDRGRSIHVVQVESVETSGEAPPRRDGLPSTSLSITDHATTPAQRLQSRMQGAASLKLRAACAATARDTAQIALAGQQLMARAGDELAHAGHELAHAGHELAHAGSQIVHAGQELVDDIVHHVVKPQKSSYELPQGHQTLVERKLLGVLRCSNKFAASSSRAGYAFLESDAAAVALFASLIAEAAAKDMYQDEMARKLQRCYRRRYRMHHSA